MSELFLHCMLCLLAIQYEQNNFLCYTHTITLIGNLVSTLPLEGLVFFFTVSRMIKSRPFNFLADEKMLPTKTFYTQCTLQWVQIHAETDLIFSFFSRCTCHGKRIFFSAIFPLEKQQFISFF